MARMAKRYARQTFCALMTLAVIACTSDQSDPRPQAEPPPPVKLSAEGTQIVQRVGRDKSLEAETNIVEVSPLRESQGLHPDGSGNNKNYDSYIEVRLAALGVEKIDSDVSRLFFSDENLKNIYIVNEISVERKNYLFPKSVRYFWLPSGRSMCVSTVDISKSLRMSIDINFLEKETVFTERYSENNSRELTDFYYKYCPVAEGSNAGIAYKAQLRPRPIISNPPDSRDAYLDSSDSDLSENALLAAQGALVVLYGLMFVGCVVTLGLGC